jgi:hypothetical protein
MRNLKSGRKEIKLKKKKLPKKEPVKVAAPVAVKETVQSPDKDKKKQHQKLSTTVKNVGERTG